MYVKVMNLPPELETKAFAYGWLRNQYLYIGSSENGVARFRNHHVLGIAEPILAGDFISIWPVETFIVPDLALRVLITKFHPKYNCERKMTTVNLPLPKELRFFLTGNQNRCRWCFRYFDDSTKEQFCSLSCFNEMCYSLAIVKHIK